MAATVVEEGRRSCLLSNGRHAVMLRADGAGWSRWQGLGLTRWRESAASVDAAFHLLLRDEEDGRSWSTTCASFDAASGRVDADFGPGRATFERSVDGVESRVDVAVAADADLELRAVRVCNRGDRARTLTLTACAEAVVGPTGADDTHPAFSKMFVETEFDAATGVLLATRRRRASSEAPLWVGCTLVAEGAAGPISHDTDRMRFLGRGRRIVDAAGMAPGAALAGTTGCVLDPVLALRRGFSLAPGEAVQIVFRMAAATSREAVAAILARNDSPMR